MVVIRGPQMLLVWDIGTSIQDVPPGVTENCTYLGATTPVVDVGELRVLQNKQILLQQLLHVAVFRSLSTLDAGPVSFVEDDGGANRIEQTVATIEDALRSQPNVLEELEGVEPVDVVVR